MTLGAFEIGLDDRLAALSKDLMDGAYWPKPTRMVAIPKRGGGLRHLIIPSIVDRVAQTAAAAVLTPILDEEFSDASFGYRPGRSVQQAVRRVALLRREGYRWIVDGDIDDFFDSVPHDRLLAKLERSVADERVVGSDLALAGGVLGDRPGSAAGAPISPLLANLFLDDVDDAIQTKGVRPGTLRR